jgi:hypothetical protein
MQARPWKGAALTLALGAVIGCAGVDGTPTDDDEPSEIDPELEGTWGRARVRTPDGEMTVSYQVVDGHAIHEEDMDLGPVRELTRRGGAVNMGERWPNGIIYFRIDEDFTGVVCDENNENCEDARTRVRGALDELEQRTPLTFIEVYDDWDGDVVEFRYADLNCSCGKSSHTGREGGVQYIRFDEDLWNGDSGNRMQPSGYRVVMHEMLHAAGMWHEQSRSDRDQFVTYHDECVQSSHAGNFDIKDDSANVGPYDFNSIMHYRANAFCEVEDDADGGCACQPLVPAVVDATIAPSDRPSVQDTATLYRVYGQALGVDNTSDHFAAAIAVGDLDGDGYEDVAIGIPDENYAGKTDSGVVLLYRGSVYGLQPWQLLTAATETGELAVANDRFGAALTIGDFFGGDNDGLDLAIGAPGRNNRAGKVYLFRGHELMPMTFQQSLTQTNGGGDNVSEDQFGASLASGRIGWLDEDTLVVGAPNDRVATPVQVVRSGSVYLFQWLAPADGVPWIQSHQRVARFTGEANAQFGATLAVGKIDTDDNDDLVVGAPGATNAAGAVTLYHGRTTSSSQPNLATGAVDVLSGRPASRFGSALAIGNLVGSGSGNSEVAVGAPMDVNAYGMVRILTGGFTPSTFVDLFDADREAGDRFGAALAVTTFLPDDELRVDLAVGAPGENNSEGRLVMYPGGSAALGAAILRQSSTYGGTNETGDQFGATLATGNIDRFGNLASTAHTGTARQDLLVGSPYEDSTVADAGSIMWLRHNATNLSGFTYVQGSGDTAP